MSRSLLTSPKPAHQLTLQQMRRCSHSWHRSLLQEIAGLKEEPKHISGVNAQIRRMTQHILIRWDCIAPGENNAFTLTQRGEKLLEAILTGPEPHHKEKAASHEPDSPP